MAPNAHIKKALTAMKVLGIEEAQTKPVLKNLLNLYDKKWDLIAEDNYRALADAIFDSQETQAAEEKKGKEKKKAEEAEASAAEVDRGKRKAHEPVEDDEDALEEPERPLKRLRRRGEAASVSASNSPSLKETTTHDQDTALVLLPSHPLTTENDLDAGALLMPKGEPFTDFFPSSPTDSLENGNSSSAPVSETEETNGRVEERHGSTAATVYGATNDMVASTPEGSSTLELASSANGEVKINLSFALGTGESSLHAPSMDDLRRAMEDVCLRQYKILDPNFSVSRFLNDIASSYLELATKAEKPANQSPDNMPSLTTNVDALKTSAAGMAFTGEGSNDDLATKARNSANQSPKNSQTTTVDVLNKSAATTANTSTVRNDDENSGVGESMGLVAVPECQVSANEFRMISSVSDITFGEETVEIPWVNEFSTKVPPPFRYMPHSLVYLDAEVKFSLGNIKDGQCCASFCGDCLSPSMTCSCATALSGCSYTKDGLLQMDFLEECISEARDTQNQVVQYCKECPLEIAKNEETLEPCKGHRKRKVIRECWRNCGCTKTCGNRVVQHGIHTKLQVFLTSDEPSGRGWGLRTLEKLPKGSFVCELAGEILTISELVQRMSSEKLTSPVILDAHWGSQEVSGVNKALCLDGTHYGNISRFINHRCGDANLIEIPVHVENMDLHYYHLGLFTTRDIEAMEELTWDYGVEFNDHVYPTRPFHCRCGSEFCRNVKRSSKSKKSKKRA